jgi:AP-3 complex subunit sigma
MIHSVLVFNESGKPRILRFYDHTPVSKQLEKMKVVYDILVSRDESASCIVKHPEQPEKLKIVYRHLATLFFVLVVDSAESELAMLDLIQVFVQALDACFENICELDVVYHWDRANYILDELIMGGMVLESSLDAVLTAVSEMSKIKA